MNTVWILPPQLFIDEDDSDERLELDKAACHIYGLIHARFILTSAGLAKMNEKHAKADFGTCPRFLCQNHKLLPVGLTDIPGKVQCQIILLLLQRHL